MSTLKEKINSLSDPQKAKASARFFKTQPGDYAESDQFLGIPVPELRKLTKEFHNSLSVNELKILLDSPFNEERLLALLILVAQFNKSSKSPSKRQEIFDFYVKHRKAVNNWNLVDLSVKEIVGAFLEDKDRSLLYDWAVSPDLWERRLAIVATFHFIRLNDFHDTLSISQILLSDKEDLIQKATGWMLRELGKRNQPLLESFLKQHLTQMPRTMLRYAIEKFPEPKRKAYLMNCIGPLVNS